MDTVNQKQRRIKVLDAVAAQSVDEPTSGWRVALQVNVHRTTVYGIINDLEDRGYITRESRGGMASVSVHPDRRARVTDRRGRVTEYHMIPIEEA